MHGDFASSDGESKTLWGGCVGREHQEHSYRQQTTLSWVGREGGREGGRLAQILMPIALAKQHSHIIYDAPLILADSD